MLDTFPNELLINIFHYLPKESQKTCISVCRSWYKAARISYYNHVVVKSYDEFLAFHMLLLTTDLGSSVQFFEWKKPCRLSTLIEFEDIVDLCPNVKEIELCEPYRVYLEQSVKLKARKFQKIQFNNHAEFTGTLAVVPYNTLLDFRSSIKYQEILTDHFFQQDRFKSIPEYLNSFTKLSTLVIRGSTIGDDLFKLSNLLPRLPYLAKLVIETQDTWLVPLDTDHITSVRFLKMKVAMASGSFLKYLMKAFPHLTSLCLDFKKSDLGEQIDVDVLDSLMRYIELIPSTKINFSGFCCKALDKKITALPDATVRISVTTEAIARWKQVTKWSVSDRHVNWKNTSTADNPLVTNDLNFNSYQMVSGRKYICEYNYICSNNYFEAAKVELPFLDFLQNAGGALTTLVIDLYPSPLSKIDLDSILTRLPLIKELVIRKTKSNFHNYVTVSAITIPHKSLKSLTMKGMKIDQFFRQSLSQYCIQLEYLDIEGCLLQHS